MMKTLEELCLLNGVSSDEGPVRDYLRNHAEPYATSIRSDAMGNLILSKKGAKEGREKLLLAAHMDEVGLMVRSITEEGYIKFVTVGGIDRRVLIGKRVQLGKEKIPGIIGLKAYHLLGRGEEKNIPKLTDFYIDIGAKNKEEVEELLSPGDLVVFEGAFRAFGTEMIQAKAIDDRIGCAVMLELLKKPLPMDCTFLFTVQEEVGTRGAIPAAFTEEPGVALILEGTTAADIPSMEDHRKICHLGEGPVIPFMDGATMYDRGLFEQLRDLAIKYRIPWQTKHYIAGGTDAAAIQRSKAGGRVAGISAPVRYLHTPSSIAHKKDCYHILQLAEAFIEDFAASP